jgi:hypothetical protein
MIAKPKKLEQLHDSGEMSPIFFPSLTSSKFHGLWIICKILFLPSFITINMFHTIDIDIAIYTSIFFSFFLTSILMNWTFASQFDIGLVFSYKVFFSSYA